MSIDGELAHTEFDVPLDSILKSRNECLDQSEVWAILKETCVALKLLQNDDRYFKLHLDVNCLIIDGSGNIKVDLEEFSHKQTVGDASRCKGSLVNSLGEMFKYILAKYSDVNKNQHLFNFIENLANSTSDDQLSIQNIEVYADRQLSESSTDACYEDCTISKISDEFTSTLQDSFVFIECSSDTDADTDFDHSISRDRDTESLGDEKSSRRYEESKYCVPINHLWSYCRDPLFRSDREILVFMYSVLTEASKTLSDERNSNKCLCLSIENILLNPLGKMYLNFGSHPCADCIQGRSVMGWIDIKYVNSVGTMMYEVTQSDQRTDVSELTVSYLFRMCQSTDMTIKSVLDFCKANSSFKAMKCRHVLRGLFNLWNHWFNVQLNYLLNLKHKYLYEISTKNLKECLRPTTTKLPISFLQLYQQDPSAISKLKYVTKLSKTSLPSYMTNFRDVVRTHLSSAFRPYNPKRTSLNSLKPENQSRINASTHFRPLVLTSERNSIHYSKEQILSPIDVTPQYSYALHRDKGIQSNITLGTSKSWRSDNHLSPNDIRQQSNMCDIGSSSHGPLNGRGHDTKSSKVLSISNRSSKINLIVEVIEEELVKSFNSDINIIGDRHLLGVADFALSLERLSEKIFSEAMKQRFTHIHWSEESLKHLYDIIKSKELQTPSIDKMKCTKHIGTSREYISIINNLTSTPKLLDVIETNPSNEIRRIYSSASANYESFEEYEETSVSPNTPSITYINGKSEEMKKQKSYPDHLYVNISSNANTSLDVIDRATIKTLQTFPNKLQSKFSFQSSEDTLFYQQIYPITLLCFPSTLIYTNKASTDFNDPMINGHKIQELLLTFQDINKNIRKKFRDLSRITELILRSDYYNKNGHKVKRRIKIEQRNLQLDIESSILSEMNIENTIVEYHSVSLETVLGDLGSDPAKRFVIFYQDQKLFQHLQFVRPPVLVSCLFARGAVSSGLMYEFFLIYREFYRPTDFIECLKRAFENIICKLQNWSMLVTKARFRLLYIVLCWIEGFYDIDISPRTLSLIKDLSCSYLVPFIRSANEIIENAVATARSSKTSLSIQFTALNKRINLTAENVHNVDIQNMVSKIDKIEQNKGKSPTTSIMCGALGLGSKDTFSIINTSPKELALCLTLMQQSYFNCIHPCHLLLYLRSLTGNNESILKSITNDRFPTQQSLPLDNFHNEIRSLLQFSGQVTGWVTSEILLATNIKLQSRIVKKLVLTCIWCKELNNYGTMTSISEALTSEKLKRAPFWEHVNAKIIKSLKDVTSSTNKLFNSTTYWPDGHESSSNALLSGVPFLPCIHAIIMHLKMSSFGTCMALNGCLKWTKLRKLCKIIDQVRLYKQFRYTSTDRTTRELMPKLKSRLEHLAHLSMDTEPRHKVLTKAL